MILTSLALAMSLQATGETAIAIENDDPETWIVEYPRIIRPFVVDYRNCLNAANRRVRGRADFEMQHRSDIPRCAETAVELKAQSNQAMSGARTALTADEVDTLFRNIGKIHIARGRDLDDQFTMRMNRAAAAKEDYEANGPQGLVIERRARPPIDQTSESGNPSAQN